MQQRKRTGIIFGAFILGAALLILSGFLVGYRKGTENPSVIKVEGIENIDERAQTADFRVFWEAWNKLKDLHIKGAEISSQELLYGAISGLAGAFHDPHTTFFPPAEAKKFEEDISGQFGGIGAELGMTEDNVLTIIAPLKDSPADRVGLKAGDLIVRINQALTQGMDVNEAVQIIRGEPGTNLTLTIFREGFSEPKDFVLTREIISVPTLDMTIDEDKIAHIQLYSFNENAPLVFYRAAYKALFEGVKGIVLDLRNNPGGYLEVANDLAGWFLNKGDVVVKEHFRVGEDQVFTARGNAALHDIPVVVLLNQGSASASEILAGALRDQNGSKIVGEHSFGKGTVQELSSLRDHSSLKITIAQWVMPSGKILDNTGIAPDVEVKLTDEDIAARRDAQLIKAKEVLKQEMGQR